MSFLPNKSKNLRQSPFPRLRLHNKREMLGRYAKKPNNSDRAVVESVPTTLPKSTNTRSSRSNNHGNGNLSPKTGKNSSKFLFCTHCGKNNHTLSNCYGYNNVCVYCKQQRHSNNYC